MANHTKPPVTKAAKPVTDLLGQLPPPVGGVIIGSPSPAEKDQMRRMGVEDAKQLPANFAAISQAAAVLAASEANNDENIPLPVPAGTKPLSVEAVDIDKMPPEQRAKYEQMIQASLQQMTEMLDNAGPSTMDRSVAAAVSAGNSPTKIQVPQRPVVDDTAADTYDTGARKEPVAAEPEGKPENGPQEAQPAATGNCARCGFPKHLADDVEIDEFDAEAYFDALMAGVPFQKVYQRYSGRMVIAVRGLRLDELDAVRRQLVADQKSGLCQNDFDLRIRGEQLQNCLQLVSLSYRKQGESSHKSVIICPQSLAEWDKTPGEVYQALCQNDVLQSLTLYRTVAAVINQFNALEHKLEQMSRDPSFCKAGN